MTTYAEIGIEVAETLTVCEGDQIELLSFADFMDSFPESMRDPTTEQVAEFEHALYARFRERAANEGVAIDGPLRPPA